jgi:hypothetical protein
MCTLCVRLAQNDVDFYPVDLMFVEHVIIHFKQKFKVREA